MRDAILASVEQMETAVLALESPNHKPEDVSSVLDRLGLSHLKLPSAQLITLFDMLKDGIQPVTPELVTALLAVCEAQKRMLYALGGFVEHAAREIEARSAALAEDRPISATTADETPADRQPATQETSTTEDTAGPSGNATSADPAANAASNHEGEDKVPPSPQPDAGTAPRQKREGIFSVRVNTEKLDNLIDSVGKLMVSYAVISQNKQLDVSVISGLREMDSIIGRIKAEVDHIRLVPLKQIFMPLHRLITSTAQKVGKKIEIQVQGDDLELDKMIVENLNEPLVHMLRNAVDHGVEAPEERLAAGKPATGTVWLAASRKGDMATLSIRDDGRGLNPDRIREKARDRGLLEEGRSYSNEDLYQFIMASGFSTADTVTDISGRGVGMDAVVNAVKGQLGGDVRVSSQRGRGTEFLITVPLDRSVNEGIVDALIARVGEETFVIPSRDVLEVFAARPGDMVDLPDGSRAVSVRGKIFPVIMLAEYFGLVSRPNTDGYLHTIVVKVGDSKAAILIDEVVSQQQAVVTGFTIPVQRLYQIPILGYGMLGETDALVVDVENLLERVKASDGRFMSAREGVL